MSGLLGRSGSYQNCVASASAWRLDQERYNTAYFQHKAQEEHAHLLSTLGPSRHSQTQQPPPVKVGWTNEPKRKGIMNTLKRYIEEHKGTLYALGVIFLIDHFFLNGALRERITKITTCMLDKVQKTLEGA